MRNLKIFRFECFEHFVFIQVHFEKQNFDAIVQFIEFLLFQMNSFNNVSVFKTSFNETKNDEHIVCIWQFYCYRVDDLIVQISFNDLNFKWINVFEKTICRFIEIHDELNVCMSWTVQTKKILFWEMQIEKRKRNSKSTSSSHDIWQDNKRYQSNMKILNIIREETDLDFLLHEQKLN